MSTVVARYATKNPIVILGNDKMVRIDFSTRNYDSAGAVTTGAEWRFVAPMAGVYHISSCVHIDNTDEALARLWVVRDKTTVALLGANWVKDAHHGLFVSGGTDVQLKAQQAVHIAVRLHQNGKSTLYADQVDNWVAIHGVA